MSTRASSSSDGGRWRTVCNERPPPHYLPLLFTYRHRAKLVPTLLLRAHLLGIRKLIFLSIL